MSTNGVDRRTIAGLKLMAESAEAVGSGFNPWRDWARILEEGGQVSDLPPMGQAAVAGLTGD